MFVAGFGPVAGQVVLFLHALGLDHSLWKGQEDALSPTVRALMPDLPGFGRSRLEQCGLDASVKACANRLVHEAGPAVVVGVSYGGWVAALLAAKHPDLVSNLVISGVRMRIPRVLAELQATAFRVMPKGGMKHGEPVSHEDLKIERAHLVEASCELAKVDLTVSLSQIVAPTVVFAPSRDWFVRRQAPKVAAGIPNARLAPLQGAGHLWIERQPTRPTECILALASTAAGDSIR
jgi:3-oxoadipate enol-lactonase